MLSDTIFANPTYILLFSSLCTTQQFIITFDALRRCHNFQVAALFICKYFKLEMTPVSLQLIQMHILQYALPDLAIEHRFRAQFDTMRYSYGFDVAALFIRECYSQCEVEMFSEYVSRNTILSDGNKCPKKKVYLCRICYRAYSHQDGVRKHCKRKHRTFKLGGPQSYAIEKEI